MFLFKCILVFCRSKIWTKSTRYLDANTSIISSLDIIDIMDMYLKLKDINLNFKFIS